MRLNRDVMCVRLCSLVMLLQLSCSAQANAEQSDFPITANLWYAPEIPNEKHTDYLSRYDWVFLDLNNAYQSSSAIEQMRGRNPNIVLLAYVNPLEIWKEGSGPDRLPFQRRIQSHLDEGMFLHTVSGRRFNQPRWDRMLVMNMTVQYPPGAAHWLDVFQSFILDQPLLTSFQGFFLDNINPAAFYTHPSPDSFDLDLNDTFDSREQLDEWHRRGTETFLMMLRRDLPNQPVVGNGGQLTYGEMLNGTVFEGFPVPWVVPEAQATPYNIWRENMARAMNGQLEFRRPNYTVFNGNGGLQEYQRMRFTLASALIAGVACSFDQGDESHHQLYWYDEYAVNVGTGIPDSPNDVVHRGYLGQPRSEFTFKDYAFLREFEHGLVICNPWKVPIEIKLDRPWRSIAGTQDPVANPGGEVTRFRLDANDGRILLKRKG